MVISSVADIVGDNGVHALGGATLQARVLILTAVGGPARFGDASVGAARGAELEPDVTVQIRASEADPTDYIALAQARAYVPSGTTLTIAYGL
jgi:hypothetical protein